MPAYHEVETAIFELLLTHQRLQKEYLVSLVLLTSDCYEWRIRHAIGNMLHKKVIVHTDDGKLTLSNDVLI